MTVVIMHDLRDLANGFHFVNASAEPDEPRILECINQECRKLLDSARSLPQTLQTFPLATAFGALARASG